MSSILTLSMVMILWNTINFKSFWLFKEQTHTKTSTTCTRSKVHRINFNENEPTAKCVQILKEHCQNDDSRDRDFWVMRAGDKIDKTFLLIILLAKRMKAHFTIKCHSTRYTQREETSSVTQRHSMSLLFNCHNHDDIFVYHIV